MSGGETVGVVPIRQVVAFAAEARLRLRPHHPLGET